MNGTVPQVRAGPAPTSLSSSPDETLGFETITLADLDALDRLGRDALPYGVVGLDPDGFVEIYNQTEARLAGLPAPIVIGTHYFSSTAQCMNNFMVAQHLEDTSHLDLTIDYVLTLRMRPTPVRLRLLADTALPRRYVLILRLW